MSPRKQDITKYKKPRLDRVVRFTEMVDIYKKYATGINQKKVFFGFLPTIDEALGGIRPSQVVAVIAPPNVGKTAFNYNFLRAQRGKFDPELEILVNFSLEASEEEIFERVVQMEMNMLTKEIEKKMEEGDEEFIERCEELMETYRGIDNIIYRAPIDEIFTYPKHLSVTSGKKVKGIFIDYLQLIIDPNSFNDYVKITNNMLALKEFALGTKIPIIVYATTSKDEVRSKKTMDMFSGKGSGEIAGSSNVVITLQEATKPEIQLDDELLKDINAGRKILLKATINKKKQGRFAHSYVVYDTKSLLMNEYVRAPILSDDKSTNSIF